MIQVAMYDVEIKATDKLSKRMMHSGMVLLREDDIWADLTWLQSLAEKEEGGPRRKPPSREGSGGRG